MTEAVVRDLEVSALLEQEQPAVEELNVELKGMGCCFALRRLRPR